MLIHISSTLKDGLADEIEKTDAVIQALQNIAQSRYQGDHIITADNGILDSIISNQALNNSTRRVFSKIDSEQTQVGALRKKLSAYVEISHIRGPISVTNNLNTKIIHIPLVRFERNDIIQPTFFIAENLLDCQFYLAIASWYSKQYSNGELPSKLRAVFCPGGGDTTEKLLKHHSRDQRYLTLCITDRDQKHPASGIGETTKKCARLDLNSLSHHITLPTRSVENLISYTQIISVLNADKDRQALIPRANRIARLIGLEEWKYFHVKNGVRDIRGPHQPGTESAFWRSVATFEEAKNAAIDDYLFPGISPNLLVWVVEHLENFEPEDFSDEKLLLGIWSDLAKLIASWTCGSDPIRA